ncbi:hypothetical protein H8356DRAFT_1633980 [Neocallimastix lanati (nom. inval.)]|jgi:hypothetical protein|uniref:Uncharacterized protein n=1 Tax=Neocallimastix californiae TaxID=1754190 RepID=A0A1Y2BCT2_9FUNG|nr:hypothetical protein H8356DRAFT_1633980 [Neocallimastix sp. JGI-2020a]ORY31895.1 hypothetical protein LY90DRAFT_705269 [Neocallimastix californiae]|eukprot:ORY31895.1 hypothetical protein LY90DRAFT_705269 [Neocallimastix californiae]
MFNEATFKNLIITEHWPSSNNILKGSNFSTSSNSLCSEYRNNINSLLNIRKCSSQTSITTSTDNLSVSSNSLSTQNLPSMQSMSSMQSIPSCYSSHTSIFTSQRSLLDTIEEEK